MNLRRWYHRWRTFYRRSRAFLGRGWLSQRTRIVLSNPNEICPNPIFIVGTHRSGTSLLRRVLDSHCHIACPPESYWLQHFTCLINDPMTFDGLWNLGFDRDPALLGLRRLAGYFHEAYRLAKSKPRWADKTPQYVEHLETLWLLFGSEARFVFIFRHPLDVAYSIWQRGWSFEDRSADSAQGTQSVGRTEKVSAACHYVLRQAERQLAFMQRHPEQVTHLHYEQLVTRPQATLTQLCQFLKEPWDATMLRHDEVPHDFGCEDPIARGTAGFRGSFGNWRGWPQPAVDCATDILRPLMQRLGYAQQTEMASVPQPSLQTLSGRDARCCNI